MEGEGSSGLGLGRSYVMYEDYLPVTGYQRLPGPLKLYVFSFSYVIRVVFFIGHRADDAIQIDRVGYNHM